MSNRPDDIAPILRRIEAAEAELAEAKRQLEERRDPCAFKCSEFETWNPGTYLRVRGLDQTYGQEHNGRPHMLLDRVEARNLRRILNIFLGEAAQ